MWVTVGDYAHVWRWPWHSRARQGNPELAAGTRRLRVWSRPGRTQRVGCGQEHRQVEPWRVQRDPSRRRSPAAAVSRSTVTSGGSLVSADACSIWSEAAAVWQQRVDCRSGRWHSRAVSSGGASDGRLGRTQVPAVGRAVGAIAHRNARSPLPGRRNTLACDVLPMTVPNSPDKGS